MSDQDQGQQQSSGRTAYTDVGKLYDNKHGALGITLVGRSIQFSVAPVFDDMIGKDPEKGKSMYDYENRCRTTVPAFKIPGFVRQIRALLEGDVAEARYESQRDNKVEYVSVFGPGVLEGLDGYAVLVGSAEGEDEPVEAVYEFPVGSPILLGYDTDGNEVTAEEEISDEMEFFTGLLITMDRLPYGLEIHGGRSGAKEFAGGSSSGNNRNAGRSSSAGKKSFSRRAGGGAGRGKPDVRDDFDDDVPV